MRFADCTSAGLAPSLALALALAALQCSCCEGTASPGRRVAGSPRWSALPGSFRARVRTHECFGLSAQRGVCVGGPPACGAHALLLAEPCAENISLALASLLATFFAPAPLPGRADAAQRAPEARTQRQKGGLEV